ncbi:MAG: TonB-dependent receptor plug domain-containing protein, partial [Mangrovibacterium sp.]
MKKKRGSSGHRPLVYQILLKMRLTVIVLLCSILGGWASQSYSQTTRLTLEASNTRIEEFLKSIEDQSEYRFFYSGKIDVNTRISGKFEDESIARILDEALKGTGILYEVTGRQIILSSVNKLGTFQQQPRAISGKVADSFGVALPGVSVVIKGMIQGTVSDSEGNYSISNVTPDAILVFSFVGMRTQEIAVAGQSLINVIMQEETVGIEEVVAIGYGTIRKKDLTGSVGSVKSTALENEAPSTIQQLLRSNVAGLNIGMTTSAKGGGTLEIRGQRTLKAGASPLIVLDGVIYNGDLNDINPNDVESVDVLKDASSAAVYGAKSANGVIIINTKVGKNAKPTVRVVINTGITSLFRS